MFDFPLFPDQASSLARQVDELYLFELGVAGFFTVLIFLLHRGLCVRYRRRSRADRSNPPTASKLMEVTWIVVPLVLGMVMFAWGARLFFKEYEPPGDALDIAVVGKQWMWHLQHPEGRSEINELHLPVGRAVKLTMISHDVIHSFYVPAFRVKQDVLPGRYSTMWFEPAQVGALSPVLRRVLRNEPFDDAGNGHGDGACRLSSAGFRRGGSGRRWRRKGSVSSCNITARAVTAAARPCTHRNWRGFSGDRCRFRRVAMFVSSRPTRPTFATRSSGPRRMVVAGYEPVMPSFQDQISEQDLLKIIAYIKSIGAEGSVAMSAPAATYQEDYLQAYTLKSWLLTNDHKRIGLLYMASITFFFFVGGAAATVMRLELLTPQGDVLHSPDAYNRLFTMHGVVMIFFFLIPSIPAVMGNFLVPLMIGARDLAFPWLNLLSWYIYMIGGSIALYILIFGGIDTGWTFYTPFSTMFSNTMVVPAATAVFITGFSSILTGLNFIVTIHTMRTTGMTWFRLPLLIWSLYATSLIMVLGTPVLAIAVALVAVERLLHVGIFDPPLGGDPILFQHLFWFYSHPAVYIMVLPGMGVISRDRSLFLPAADLRLPVHRVFEHGDRGAGLSGVGTPHVRLGPVDVRRNGFLDLELPGGGSVGDQGIQLDGDDVQGVDPAGHADALRARVHRPFHAGRAHGADAGHAGGRRARARHVFRGGAFPLHHGGRRGDGLHGGHSLLVAQDERADVPGALGQALGAGGIRRLQLDVFSPVRAGLSGHAAALLRIPGGVSSAERDVDCRRFDSGGWICSTACVSVALAAQAALRRSKPVERHGARVGDRIAAAGSQL